MNMITLLSFIAAKSGTEGGTNTVHVKKFWWLRLACGTAAILLLAGCASYKLPTNSGYPEITTAASSAEVKKALTSYTLEHNPGFQITQESESVLVFEGPMSSGANFWFTNTLTGVKPTAKLRFNIIDVNGQRRVTGYFGMIHQPGLGGSSETQMDMKKHQTQLQQFMENVKSQLGQ